MTQIETKEVELKDFIWLLIDETQKIRIESYETEKVLFETTLESLPINVKQSDYNVRCFEIKDGVLIISIQTEYTDEELGLE